MEVFGVLSLEMLRLVFGQLVGNLMVQLLPRSVVNAWLLGMTLFFTKVASLQRNSDDGFVKEGYKRCWHKRCSTIQQYHVLHKNGE